MPLPYTCEYSREEFAPPLSFRSPDPAAFRRDFERWVGECQSRLSSEFQTRRAPVNYDPGTLELRLSYSVADTEPGASFRFAATIRFLLSAESLENVAQGIEVYPVVRGSVRRVLDGFWVPFSNDQNLHQQLIQEVIGLLQNKAGG